VTALHDITKSVETRAGYNTTGSVIFGRDPDGFSSKVEYSFHTGLVARAEDPRKAQQTFTYDAAGRPVRVEVSGRDGRRVKQ
jgi:YD repeat-containing protein